MSKQIKIVHVSDDNCDVSLNVGSINGVQEGDKFLVYSLSDHEIVDPDTGESLGYLEFVKGTGEVVHVQDKMCTITSVTYRKPVAKKTIRKTTPSMTMWAGSTVKKLFRMITGSRYLLTILMWEILQNLFKYSFQKLCTIYLTLLFMAAFYMILCLFFLSLIVYTIFK